jgi:hypothetical protein
VQVLTEPKLPGHDNQSTQPPQWFVLGPEGAKGKTCDVAVRPLATVLPLAFALAWPHAHTCRQRECVQCVDCECRVCVLRVATGLVNVVAYVWNGLFFCCWNCEEFLLSD